METFDLTESYDECDDVSGLCLVGKILTHKTLNRTVVSNILQNAWKSRSQLEISPWGDNVYLFQFSESEDRCKVHVHGLPLDKMSKKHGDTIGNRLGKLIVVEALLDGLFLGYGLDMRTSMVKHIGAPYGSYQQPPIEDSNADSLVRRSTASPSSADHIEAGGGRRDSAPVLVAGMPVRGEHEVKGILSCMLPQDFPLPQDTTCLPKPDGMQVTATLSESGPA
ncbi:hypothetical protein ACSBR1_032468 [Camellia fascicularis]